MAYVWWQEAKDVGRILQCGLGESSTPSLNIRLFIPLWHVSNILELQRQGIIALSSTEAEYIAETHVVKEGIWLKSFVKEIVGKERGALTICWIM